MADAHSIPDTTTVPVAQDLMQTQNGSVPGQHTDINGGQVGSADQQAAAPYSNGQGEQPSDSKGGILNSEKALPEKGPRSGIHWGAGVQSAPCFSVCTL